MAARSRGLRRALRALLAAALIAAAAAALSVVWLNRPLALAGPSAELSIEPGTSPREIAAGWVEAGV